MENLLEEIVRPTPVYNALKFEVKTIRPGYCHVSVPKNSSFDGIYGYFHGGIMATVSDSAAALAILSEIGTDKPITTTDFYFRFLRPCETDIECKAVLIKSGKRLCTVEANLYDMNEILVATSMVTYIVLDKVA